MKAIVNSSGEIIAYTQDSSFQPANGVLLCDLPIEGNHEQDMPFYCYRDKMIVVDEQIRLNHFKTIQKAQIKEAAARLIASTDWKLQRAKERETSGWATLAEVDAVLAERESIRRSSNAAEAAVDALTDVASVQSFAWSVDVQVAAPRRLTHQQFLARFADAEMQAILAAEAAQPAVATWLERFRLAGYVNLTDPSTVAGVQALEIAGLLGTGRAGEVLA